MCGRYTQTAPYPKLAERFGLSSKGPDLLPRYNIAPSQDVPVVVAEGGSRLETMRWGLIPHWAKDPAIGHKMINARAETLAEKPSFKKSLQTRRCLVVADGFYEWREVAGRKAKIPMRIVLKDREPFAFAGLWDEWKDPKGGFLHSFTIVTTEANDLLRPIHNRMPVILLPEEENAWLDPDLREPEKVVGFLKPHPAERMGAYEVSLRVNSPKNDSEACIERV